MIYHVFVTKSIANRINQHNAHSKIGLQGFTTSMTSVFHTHSIVGMAFMTGSSIIDEFTLTCNYSYREN